MCTVYTQRHTHDVEYSWRDDGLAVTKRHILFLFFSLSLSFSSRNIFSPFFLYRLFFVVASTAILFVFSFSFLVASRVFQYYLPRNGDY